MDKKSSFIPMIIIGILFFIFGFVTWLNGSLIPFLKVILELNDFEALFVTFAFLLLTQLWLYQWHRFWKKLAIKMAWQ